MADVNTKTTKKFLELKEQVEAAQQKADKAEGALEEVLKQLKRDFGCATIEAAQKKLKQLNKEKEKLEEEFNAGLEQYEKDWPESED